MYISWRLIQISQQAFVYLHRLHQIPCCKCVFFTNNHRLKCTIHPITAMTEESINCGDFIANVANHNTCSDRIINSNCDREHPRKYCQTASKNL